MFSYKLIDGLNTNTYILAEGQVKFDPPVYEQRYTTVIRIIEDQCWKHPLKKVVDFGCSEMGLLPLIRRIPHVEHILEVDVDGEVLTRYQQKATPLISDYLKRRENPLRIEILQGSITDAVDQLYDVDVVIGIEIIEHLQAEVLENVPENVFGFIQPKLAIFSTPNSEFNVLFQPLLENGFRHYDHKFEWTREEFESWAHDICKKYSNYSVCFMGVGSPPPGHEKLGHSTQIAIFARNDMIDKPLCHEIVKKPTKKGVEYKVIRAVDFPFNKDERSMEQKILDETNYYINQSKNNPKYFNRERCIYQLPWKRVFDSETMIDCIESEFLEILKTNNFKIEGDFIVLPEYDESDYVDDLDYDGNYNLEAEPFRHDLNDEDELASNLASGCNIIESEEDWD